MNLLERRRAMMMQQPRLPWGYQEVEYLQSSGTQYIDMIYSYVVNDEIECSFSVDQETGAIQGIFGNGNLPPYIGVVLYMNNLKQLTSTIGGRLGSDIVRMGTITLGQKYNIRYSGRDIYIDGAMVETVPNALTNGTQSDFSLFRRWNTNTYRGKMYSFSIKRNGTARHNFIPCYRKSDHVAGMYDLVTNTFYTNAGTGSFIVGPDVN